MTAARLQRYAIFLSAHNYSIQYRRTEDHANADALSRLPYEAETETEVDCAHLFYMEQVKVLPVTATAIKTGTRYDPILSRVYTCVATGNWETNTELTPFYNKRSEISLHQGCLVWGPRVIIPKKLRACILKELHDGHLGIVKMKCLARSYVWWPKIDEDIERIAKACSGCLQSRNKPSEVILHPWEWANFPWQRIHIDFAGPFLNHMFLVVVDSYSKWPEVVPVRSTTTSATVDVLQTIFARNGIPEQIVSDNGPQFTSTEFKTFLDNNGIKHITTAPHYPATNGQAERFVQTFKKGLRSMREEKGSISEKLSKFLLQYRNTPHALTNECPAVLFVNRQLRMRLDLVRPNIRENVEKKLAKQSASHGGLLNKTFSVGQQVATLDYRGSNKWAAGVIAEKVGTLVYNVRVYPNMIWKRHANQIIEMPESELGLSNGALISHNSARISEDYRYVGSSVNSADNSTCNNIPPSGNLSSNEPSICNESAVTVHTAPNRRYPDRIRRAPDRLNL